MKEKFFFSSSNRGRACIIPCLEGCKLVGRDWWRSPPPPLFFDLLVHFGFFASYTNCCNLWLLFYYGWGDLLGKIGNKKKNQKMKKIKMLLTLSQSQSWWGKSEGKKPCLPQSKIEVKNDRRRREERRERDSILVCLERNRWYREIYIYIYILDFSFLCLFYLCEINKKKYFKFF